MSLISIFTVYFWIVFKRTAIKSKNNTDFSTRGRTPEYKRSSYLNKTLCRSLQCEPINQVYLYSHVDTPIWCITYYSLYSYFSLVACLYLFFLSQKRYFHLQMCLVKNIYTYTTYLYNTIK